MLNRKFAIALAIAMVMAVLYGCSSDSGIKSDRDDALARVMELEGEVMGLEGQMEAVAQALGLAADASQADILAAIATATEDQLVAIRTALDLSATADPAAIVGAIEMLQGDMGEVGQRLEEIAQELGLPADASQMDILAAIAMATEDQLVAVRTALDLPATDDAAAIVAAIVMLQNRPQVPVAADLSTEYLHEQAVVAGINAMDADRPLDDDDANTDPFSTVMVDSDLSVEAGDLEAAGSAPDAGMSVQAMLSKVDGTTTDKAFVYSNRMGAGDVAWNVYYDTVPTAGPGATAVASVEGVDAEGATASGDDIVTYQLTFQGGADAVNMDAALFMAANFPSAASQSFSYSENPDNDAMTMDDNRKFNGSFHGVMGEYECPASCTAVTNPAGELTTLTGGWTFTPAEVPAGGAPHMVMGVGTDDTYVYFGYWLRQEVDAGEEKVGVNVFSGGNVAITPADMASIECAGMASGTCSATYTGKAGGKYVVKTVTPRSEVATLHTGQFVADVTLNANFGGGSIATLFANRISGDIKGFVDEASNEDRIGHWNVKLGTALTSSTAVDADTNRAANVGVTNDGMMGGTWTHQFFNLQEADADTTPEEETMPPGDVAGTFDAHWSDGHAIGAYGAERN